MTQPLPVFDVSAYESPRAAAEAVRDAGGGILYFGPRTWRKPHPIDATVRVYSNTWVLGAGPGTVVRRNDPELTTMFLCAGQSNVRFSNITFDAATHVPDRRVIWCDEEVEQPDGRSTVIGAEHISVSDCKFVNSYDEKVDPENTMLAVLARKVSHLRFVNNTVEGLQVKVGGAGKTHDALVANNSFTRSKQYAVSAVDTYGGGISDVVISTNTMIDCRNGGVYIGGEKKDPASAHRISVVGNTIVAGPLLDNKNGAGIKAQLATESSNWTIANNNVVDGRYPDPPDAGGFGLVVGPDDRNQTMSRVLRNLVVTGNTFRGWRKGSIRLHGTIDGFAISGNSILDGRGLEITTVNKKTPPISRTIKNGTIQGNHASGLPAADGILVAAGGESIDRVRIVGNVFHGFEHGLRVRSSVADVEVDVTGNTFRDNVIAAIREEPGSGALRTRYFDNDCRDDAIETGPDATRRGNLPAP